jgi:hypothetical protein
VTAAWVSVVLLLVGLPLMAWWVGGRRFWARQDARGGADPTGEILRRHGLGSREAAEVVGAVTAGTELPEPRMRAAAVELAELTLRQVAPSWQEASPARRVLIACTALWAVLVLTGAVFVAVLEGPGEVHWLNVAAVLLIVGPPFLQARKLRRTIERNSAPVGEPRDGAA